MIRGECLKKLKPVLKKKTKIILIFNTLIKIGLSILFIILFNIQSKNYSEFKKLYNGYYEPWKEASNYVALNLQGSDPGDFYLDDFYKKQEKLYKKFNKDGAIVAEFTMCKTPSKDIKYKTKYFKLHGMVNPNYLKKHAIYDNKGDEVSISEKNKNCVTLVPDKYKKDENQIRKNYEDFKNHFQDNKSGKVEIIWTRPNQKYFSYNASVNTKEGNYVKDPIVLVGTEEGLYHQWSNCIFNVEGDPVKVKVDKDIPLDEQIEPVIKSVGIDSSDFKINFINEKVMANNIKFKNLLESLVITISWIIIGVTSILLKKASTNIILTITLTGFIIESLISIRFLDLINKKTLIEAMK